MDVTISRATESDWHIIESVFADAVERQKNENPLTRWTADTIKRENLMPDFGIECFSIAYVEGKPAGVIAITDENSYVYPDIPKGKSLFIRWLAVKQEFAKAKISTRLIDYAKDMCTTQYLPLLLEIQRIRKVQEFYLSHGFRICGKFFDKRTPALLQQLIWDGDNLVSNATGS